MSNYESSTAAAGVNGGNPVYSDAGEECRQDDVVLSIENVARMFKHPRLALRYYELRGLIKRRSRVGSIRVFDWADCGVIAFIVKCRRAGLTLGEIAPVIRSARGDGSVHKVKSGPDPCLTLIDRLERRRQALDEALDELRHTFTLSSTDLIALDCDIGPASQANRSDPARPTPGRRVRRLWSPD
jgi:DNA-binding transcriptional MerR regulator